MLCACGRLPSFPPALTWTAGSVADPIVLRDGGVNGLWMASLEEGHYPWVSPRCRFFPWSAAQMNNKNSSVGHFITSGSLASLLTFSEYQGYGKKPPQNIQRFCHEHKAVTRKLHGSYSKDPLPLFGMWR
jgi:hypothetical protein